jgi:arabinofuranosyltransferase
VAEVSLSCIVMMVRLRWCRMKLRCLLIFFIFCLCLFTADSIAEEYMIDTNIETTDLSQLVKENKTISFKTYHNDGYIVFKRGFGIVIYDLSEILYYDSKRFKIVDGLSDERSISIESVESPGYYWIDNNGRIEIKKIDRKKRGECKRATFKVLPAFRTGKGDNLVSFESSAYPDTFIIHHREELFVQKYEDTDSFKTDSSFHITQPLEITYNLVHYLMSKPVITLVLFLVTGSSFMLLFLCSRKGKSGNAPFYTVKALKMNIQIGAETIIMTVSFIICFLLLFYVIFTNAWVCDDAYITFRSIDNFIHGYGLTWNIDERVQVYTHPLWMLLLSLFYFFTREIYITSIVVSIVLSLLSVAIISQGISKTKLFTLLCIILFCYSKAFVEYATSGLENPLSYIIIALFFFVYLNEKTDEKKLLYLSVIAAFGIVNRLDTLLIYIPPLVFAYIKAGRWKKGLLYVLIGFLPLYIWELFSLLYYGFPFPNTAYAKLNAGIPEIELWNQGLDYILTTMRTDPITFFIILCGVSVSFVLEEKQGIPIGIGILLYVLYIIKIGGCFMAGRYFALPFVCAVIILSQIEHTIMKWLYVPFTAIVLIVGFFSLHTIVFSEEYDNQVKYYNGQISNEKAFYFRSTGLRKRKQYFSPQECRAAQYGLAFREKGKHVVVRQGIGIEGFYAGPSVHIIDSLGLADAFLARLYCTYEKGRPGWVIGHFRREIPEGYIETIESGKNVIVEKELAAFYDTLSLLIRGNIFDGKRFVEMIKFNAGCYNALLSRYNHQVMKNREKR